MNKRILQVHNSYQDQGGEDVVVAREKEMLEEAGHDVSQYIVSNTDINTISQKFQTAISLPFSKTQKKKLERILKYNKPDVVHIHNFLPILTPSIFYACKKMRIPVVLTLHNFRLLCSNGLLYRKGRVCELCINKKWALPAIQNGCYQNSRIKSIFPVLSNALHTSLDTWSDCIDKVIFLTEFSKDVFLRSHIKFAPSQIAIKPNFVVDRGYTYDKENFFLFVGRLSQEKGIMNIIKACINTNSALKIVGTGPLEHQIRQLAIQYDFIDILGYKSELELQEYYLKAKALITASKMYETFGLVIIEAFSCGTTVIAPDLGAASTIIISGENGLLYDLTQKDSLEKTINNFDSTNQRELQENARKCFEYSFKKAINFEKLNNIYDNVIVH